MITLKPTKNIDHDFLTLVGRILINTLQIHRPPDVYVVLIDNWFDHKWLEFYSNRLDNDADGWRTKLVLPRFEPSRVLSQTYFQARPSDPLIYEESLSNPLHILTSRRSVAQICSSGVLIWYSYADEKSDRGSLMTYISEDGKGSAWYAAFTKNPEWQVGKVKGISTREFKGLMTGSTTPGGM